MKSATIDQIKKVHGSATDRCAISIMDTWLRQDFMKNGPPYNLHEEQYQCPSWWNLVWAVARETGGQNPAHAEKIAKEYRGLLGISPSHSPSFFLSSIHPSLHFFYPFATGLLFPFPPIFSPPPLPSLPPFFCLLSCSFPVVNPGYKQPEDTSAFSTASSEPFGEYFALTTRLKQSSSSVYIHVC